MPTTRPRPNETREMRLVGKVIELSSLPETDLPAFIAVRRLPGDSWRTWDEISFELAEVTGEIVTDMTLRHWAKRYDIPEDTKRDDADLHLAIIVPDAQNADSGYTKVYVVAVGTDPTEAERKHVAAIDAPVSEDRAEWFAGLQDAVARDGWGLIREIGFDGPAVATITTTTKHTFLTAMSKLGYL